MQKLLRRRRRYRLKDVKPDEVSLVNAPAFRPSRWLFLKSLAVSFDYLELSNKPLHEFVHLENVGDDDLALLATAIVLAPGDKKPDGGKYSEDEIAALERLWASRYGSTNRDGRFAHQSIYENGQKNGNVAVVSFGIAPDGKTGISLAGADGKTIPPGSWFLQLLIDDSDLSSTAYDSKTGKTASRIVRDKKIKGVGVVNAAVLLKATAGGDWPGGFGDPLALSYGDSDEVSPEELGEQIVEAVTEGIEQAEDEVSPTEFGEEIVGAIVDGLTGE